MDHFWSKKFFLKKIKILIFFLQNSILHFVFMHFRVFRGICGIISKKGEKFRSKNKMLKLRGPETHFSAVTCGQKTVVCDFCHLNSDRYNISREFGWLLDVPVNFGHIHYGFLVYSGKPNPKYDDSLSDSVTSHLTRHSR